MYIIKVRNVWKESVGFILKFNGITYEEIPIDDKWTAFDLCNANEGIMNSVQEYLRFYGVKVA